MIAIWPQYMNKNLTLKEGRKIAKDDCVSDPTINDIERALKRLNLSHNIQKENKKKTPILENGMKSQEGRLLNGKEQNSN